MISAPSAAYTAPAYTAPALSSSVGAMGTALGSKLLPRPNPPVGWVLTKCSNNVVQTFNAVLYTYNFTYSSNPPTEGQLPAPSKLSPPEKPPAWIIDEETMEISSKENSVNYKYQLSYCDKKENGLLAKKEKSKEKLEQTPGKNDKPK